MNDAALTHLVTQLMWIVLITSLPVVLVASAVGILVSLFQALTQIQDQTLQLMIKLLAVAITLNGQLSLARGDPAGIYAASITANWRAWRMIALTDLVVTVAFALIRPLGLTLLFQLFNTRSLGNALIRNGVLLVLMVPILPVVYEQAAQLRGWGCLQLLHGELLIGVILGFCAVIPFWAVDMVGFLIDTLRGATIGSVYNSVMAMQTSLFGLLFSQFLCVPFFLWGGINLLLSVLYGSYRAFLPGTTLALDHRLFDFILMQWQLLYRLCLSFSLPAVLSMILVDLAFGLINRSARQLNVFFLSMPIKSALVLLLLLLSLPYAFHHYLRETETLYPSLSAGWLRHE